MKEREIADADLVYGISIDAFVKLLVQYIWLNGHEQCIAQ
jgi:hypothetical protein